MAANDLQVYDYYIMSDDSEWVNRMLQKLSERGFHGYHSEKFPAGKILIENREHAVEEYSVIIIGFPSPSKKKGGATSIVATLSTEIMEEKDRVICVRTSKDSVIPKYFSLALSTCENWDIDINCDRIADAIESVKREGSGRRSRTSEYTGDTVDSATGNQDPPRGDTVDSATGNQDPPRENMPADAGDAGDTVDSATGNQDPPRENMPADAGDAENMPADTGAAGNAENIQADTEAGDAENIQADTEAGDAENIQADTEAGDAGDGLLQDSTSSNSVNQSKHKGSKIPDVCVVTDTQPRVFSV